MISYTVDSVTYDGAVAASVAGGAHKVFFAEPFTCVKVITRQTITSDGWAGSLKRTVVSGTGTDLLYKRTAQGAGLDLDAYVAALGVLKGAWNSVSVIDPTTYKSASMALDTARDGALGSFRTAMGFMNPANQEYFGRIYSASMPYPRAVRIYEYHSGELVDTSYPDSTGLFSFSGLAVGKYYLTAHDFDKLNADKNPIIKTVTIS